MNNGRWIKFLCEQQDPEDDTDYGSEESPFNHNVKILKQYFNNIEEKNLESADILDEIQIGNELGSGSFGRVFEIKDSNRAIKFFEDSVDMDKDMKRAKEVSDDIYSGKASLMDFHVFDHGKLGNTDLYYIIMPKIIPLQQAPFYKISKVFSAVADYNYDAARYFDSSMRKTIRFISRKELTLDDWIEYVIKGVRKYGDPVTKVSEFPDDLIKTYYTTLFKIMEAGYRAYMKFDGIDLHSRNIGYYAQKPDAFFYFDM